MSLKSRARKLMKVYPLTYQQALQRIQTMGILSAQYAKENNVPLSAADVALCENTYSRRQPKEDEDGRRESGER